ncbi:hypothetical protein NPX13_g6391 [Xylaria arbuscula]|uniref:P-type domain-containing protein n=1 Tax=Xylaria arbuscula TaxID=114810 RepID=A0A9W8TKG1_9PEZI|nr:hypothetical protein NPX13_g6391 [Xylaria arbuscula]
MQLASFYAGLLAAVTGVSALVAGTPASPAEGTPVIEARAVISETCTPPGPGYPNGECGIAKHCTVAEPCTDSGNPCWWSTAPNGRVVCT